MPNGSEARPPPPSGPSYGYELPSTLPPPDFRWYKIDKHVEMLSQISDAAAHAAAEMWGNAAAAMDATGDNLRRYGSDLREDWRSAAAKPFMEHVSNSTQSLQQWAEAARSNESRLHRLGDAIQMAQEEMRALNDSFVAESADINKNEAGPAEILGGFFDKGDKQLKEMTQQKTEQSLRIMETLSEVFAHTTIEDAPKFAGPTAARPAAPAAPGAPGAPGTAPGAPGAPGAAPAAPGGTPRAPQRGPAPKAPPRGPAPVAPPARGAQPMAPNLAGLGAPPMAPNLAGLGAPPTAPNLAGLGAPPTAPNLAGLGAPPMAPNLAGLSAPPAAPLLGGPGAPTAGLGGSRGAPPAAPNLAGLGAGSGGAANGGAGGSAGRGPGPAAPGSMGRSSLAGPSGLQGRNAPGAPGSMPGGGSRGSGAGPQLPGRSGLSSGSPGMPPGSPGSPGGRPGGGNPGRGAPGAPSLPGRQAPRSAGARPGGMGSPGSGVPRSLQGSRGNPSSAGSNVAAGRPLNGRSGIRPGSPASTGMPGLRGRSGPARLGRSETAQTTRAALRRGLDGRGISPIKGSPTAMPSNGPTARPAQSGPAKQHAGNKAAPAAQIVGDEELFAVDQAAPAVIERQKEKVHAKRPGPALGRG